jgi:hypothetical protein
VLLLAVAGPLLMRASDPVVAAVMARTAAGGGEGQSRSP